MKFERGKGKGRREKFERGEGVAKGALERPVGPVILGRRRRIHTEQSPVILSEAKNLYRTEA